MNDRGSLFSDGRRLWLWVVVSGIKVTEAPSGWTVIQR